jgi:hypothetical protein
LIRTAGPHDDDLDEIHEGGDGFDRYDLPHFHRPALVNPAPLVKSSPIVVPTVSRETVGGFASLSLHASMGIARETVEE